MKVENHISIHSNLNLNGLVQSDQRGIGKEVKRKNNIVSLFTIPMIKF
jgi:hypothetical protein